MKEIKDIAMYEETDSELAKYHIQQTLNRIQDLKEQIKELFDEYLELQARIDKAIEYIKEINNHNYSILVNGEETILDKKEILDTKMGEMQKLERILIGEDNESN